MHKIDANIVPTRELVDFPLPDKSSEDLAVASPETARPQRVLARVEVFLNLASARPDWEKLQVSAYGSAYQTTTFFEAALNWTNAKPLIVVGYDETDAPTFLLPLILERHGFVTIARFAAGRNSNLNTPLIHPDLALTTLQARDLFYRARALAHSQGVAIDAYILQNQPVNWTAPNPLVRVSSQPSPSDGSGGDIAAITPFSAHDSKAARKRWRQKIANMEKLGAVSLRRILEPGEIESALGTLVTLKRARFQAQGKLRAVRSLEDAPFWRALAIPHSAAPALELYGLFVSARLIAVYGGLPFRDQWHFMLNAFDVSPDVARSSPADYLLRFVLEDLAGRGFRSFEFGVGEAGYKDKVCNRKINMADTLIATSAKGAAAVLCARLALALKRFVKRSPRLLKFLHSWLS